MTEKKACKYRPKTTQMQCIVCFLKLCVCVCTPCRLVPFFLSEEVDTKKPLLDFSYCKNP